MQAPPVTRCRNCGQVASPLDRFCASCGASVAPSATEIIAPEGGPRGDRILEALRAATIGECDIAGELGRGGMAVVYLAHDIQLNRKVAIKSQRHGKGGSGGFRRIRTIVVPRLAIH